MSSSDSQIMNYLVRMVVPMRREFGRNLDVHHFLHDRAYAREVLEHASQSRDQRLREYAAYVETAYRGRGAPLVQSLSAAAKARPSDDAAITDEKERELKALVMKKYTTGLR